MKKVEYDDFWLRIDSRNMGFLFEQCDTAMRDLYGIDIDIKNFLTTFMNSDVRKKMEAGNPRLLSQSYIDTIECFIEVDCNGDYEQFKLTSDSTNPNYFPLERMWIGRMYVKIAYRFELCSAEVIKLLPLHEMRDHYLIGHEISEEAYLDSIRSILVVSKDVKTW